MGREEESKRVVLAQEAQGFCALCATWGTQLNDSKSNTSRGISPLLFAHWERILPGVLGAARGGDLLY